MVSSSINFVDLELSLNGVLGPHSDRSQFFTWKKIVVNLEDCFMMRKMSGE